MARFTGHIYMGGCDCVAPATAGALYLMLLMVASISLLLVLVHCFLGGLGLARLKKILAQHMYNICSAACSCLIWYLEGFGRLCCGSLTCGLEMPWECHW